MFSEWTMTILDSTGIVNIKKKSNVWTQGNYQGINDFDKQVNKVIIKCNQI